jgi:predicted O-methyltransferase YrrM
MIILNKTIINILKNGYCMDENGNKKIINDSLSSAELMSITRAMQECNAKNTLETGVANGLSTLAICDSIKNKGLDAMHYGIDPNQESDYGNSALLNLMDADLKNMFSLLEGPSHLMIPKLINKNIEIDFALIDGWHTFDYTLIDFFLIDKILKVGGIIAFHDCHSLAKQKVLRYIESHRKYRYIDNIIIHNNESKFFTFKFFVWRLFQKPKLLFSKYFWRYQFKNSSGLVMIMKTEQFEPNFNFYKSF